MMEDGPYTCKYCGTTFKSLQSLKSHLQNCPERSLPREFSKGKVSLVCYMNPKRRFVNALNSMIRKPDFDERQLLGAVRVLEEAGIIHRITMPEIQKQ